MIQTITDIREGYEELAAAIEKADTATASLSNGKFSCYVDGQPSLDGNNVSIRVPHDTTFISFPENYIRKWKLSGNNIQFTLRNL